MVEQTTNSSNVYAYVIANSLFTPRQLSIISKQLEGSGKPEEISSGAYYRQIKQCRRKIVSVLYSMILLQSTGVIHPEASSTLGKLAEQLAVIFASESSDTTSSLNVDDVTSVIDQVIKKVSNL
jgi:hypothetical protein